MPRTFVECVDFARVYDGLCACTRCAHGMKKSKYTRHRATRVFFAGCVYHVSPTALYTSLLGHFSCERDFPSGPLSLLSSSSSRNSQLSYISLRATRSPAFSDLIMLVTTLSAGKGICFAVNTRKAPFILSFTLFTLPLFRYLLYIRATVVFAIVAGLFTWSSVTLVAIIRSIMLGKYSHMIL